MGSNYGRRKHVGLMPLYVLKSEEKESAKPLERKKEKKEEKRKKEEKLI